MFRQLIARIGKLESTPPWGFVAGLGSVIVAFAAVLMGTTLVLLTLNDVQYAAMASWTLGAVITIAFVYIRFRKPEERAALRIGVQNDQSDTRGSDATSLQELFLMLLIGVGLSVALDVVSGRVTNTFGVEPELQRLYVESRLTGVLFISWAFAVVFMVILQPIAEELIFRGLLLPTLRTATGAWPGYVLTTLLYSVFHLITYTSAPDDPNSLWYGLAVPFIAGLTFGAIRLYTGSTRAAMLAHIGFGLFAVVKLITLIG